MRLILGNKNYSSWSLRGWLVARRSGLDFEELRLPLFTEAGDCQLAELCPAGLVPVLEDGERVIWDSLSIAEYLAERCPGLWPAEPAARAAARSACAEMHSGFPALRGELPMNCRRQPVAIELSSACEADVARIQQLWGALREQFGGRGPWLCGEWSVVDGFFAPVALRLDRYAVTVGETAGSYIQTQLADPLLGEWLAAAAAEPEVIALAER